MPWWLTTIFPALLICFVIGFLLGLLLMWRRLREMQNDFERRRLEGEAESDRLRLRISALRERDQRATQLEGELEEALAGKDRLHTLQGQLQEAETKAHLVPALEQQLTESRERALMADRLQEEVEVLRAQSRADRSLPRAEEPAGVLPETAVAAAVAASAAETETLTAELRSTRIELEETRSRTGQLDAELRAAVEERDRLEAQLSRNGQAQADDAPKAATTSSSFLATSDSTTTSDSTASQPSDGPSTVGPSDNGATWTDDGGWQEGNTTLGTPGANHTDDLKAINGIGPVMERTLNEFGIRTWEQIAVFSQADIDKVSTAIKSFPGRIERDDWVGGAKELLAAGHVPGEDTTNRPLTSNRRKRQR